MCSSYTSHEQYSDISIRLCLLLVLQLRPNLRTVLCTYPAILRRIYTWDFWNDSKNLRIQWKWKYRLKTVHIFFIFCLCKWGIYDENVSSRFDIKLNKKALRTQKNQAIMAKTANSLKLNLRRYTDVQVERKIKYMLFSFLISKSK